MFKIFLDYGLTLNVKFMVSYLVMLPHMKNKSVDIVHLLKEIQKTNSQVRMLADAQSLMSEKVLQLEGSNRSGSLPTISAIVPIPVEEESRSEDNAAQLQAVLVLAYPISTACVSSVHTFDELETQSISSTNITHRTPQEDQDSSLNDSVIIC